MVDLEQLSEDIYNEAIDLKGIKDELESHGPKGKYQTTYKNCLDSINHIYNNLKTFSGLVYQEFEEDYSNQCEKLQDENKLLRRILEDILSHQDKIDIRIKYGIEID